MVLHLVRKGQLVFRDQIAQRVDQNPNHELGDFLLDTAGLEQAERKAKYELVLGLTQVLGQDHLVNVANLWVNGCSV